MLVLHKGDKQKPFLHIDMTQVFCIKKGGIPMGYITFNELIDFATFVVALIGLLFEVFRYFESRKNTPNENPTYEEKTVPKRHKR